MILGFSVISGIEILYWLWFKILFHKKDVEERVLIEELKMDDITWLITHIIVWMSRLHPNLASEDNHLCTFYYGRR